MRSPLPSVTYLTVHYYSFSIMTQVTLKKIHPVDHKLSVSPERLLHRKFDFGLLIDLFLFNYLKGPFPLTETSSPFRSTTPHRTLL